MSWRGYNLYKVNKWRKLLLGAFAGAAIIYTVKKHICYDKFLPEALKSFSNPFKLGQSPPRVKSIYPDRQTFAFRHDSPIWIEFDMPMNNATITKETVIIRSSAKDMGKVMGAAKVLAGKADGKLIAETVKSLLPA